MVLGVFLAGTVFAGIFISDGHSGGMIWPDSYYDDIAHNTWSDYFKGGPEGKSGAYFSLSTGITTGGQLINYSDIVSVEAERQETKRELNLMTGGCTTWMGQSLQWWVFSIRPAEWMVHGNLKYILTYVNGQETHRQTNLNEVGTVIFPIPPSHIQVTSSLNGIRVSWSGIGPHDQNTDYKIRVFDESDCGTEDYKGGWSGGIGTYDKQLNKVIFNLPSTLRNKLIRFENRINVGSQMSRSTRWTTFP